MKKLFTLMLGISAASAVLANTDNQMNGTTTTAQSTVNTAPATAPDTTNSTTATTAVTTPAGTTVTAGSTATTPATQPVVNIADLNQKAGDAFLAANKYQNGVVTTASGLQYKVLEAGNGAKPGKTDTVTVDYEGKHLDGQIFDSSYQRGQPAAFPLNRVIPGWQEALQLMNAGSTWELYIPANLAYGQRGVPGAIAPNETLLFKVHLIGINKAS